MTRDTRKVLVAFLVIAAVCVAFLAVLFTFNARAETDAQRRFNKITRYVLTPQQRGPEIGLHGVGAGCEHKVATEEYFNRFGDKLIVTSQSADWCWSIADGKPGKFLQGPNWDRWYWLSPHALNLYRLDRWDQPVTGSGVNSDGWRYRYRRQAAHFEACAAWCFMDAHDWVSQTVRASGTYAADAGND